MYELQLDWTFYADTHKINFSRDREDYGGSETTYEKLSSSASMCAGYNFISFFRKLFLKKLDKTVLKMCTTHSWMRLIEISSMEFSGAAEVPQSRGKLIFKKSSCYVSAQKSISIAKNCVDRNKIKKLSTIDN